MEYSGRGSHSSPAHYSGRQFSEESASGPENSPAAPQGSRSGKRSTNSPKLKDQKLARIGVALFGLLVLLLVVWIIIGVAFSDKSDEKDYVDSSRLQAVFLQTGQVYFGNIKNIDSDSINLQNIYYLQTSEAASSDANKTAASNVSLVKLGCELHAPQDRMIINRDQVTFWENLNTDGQVAKAVASFQKSNPNGQKCSDSATNASTNGANVQGTPTTNNSSNSSNSSN